MRTDYLKYDAASIQELLKRKLIESGIYTDQVYPGSDTSVLIDLFAWTFDALTYILNNNVSDVLFQDTQIYGNLNRLVKLLSYSPRGFTTATAQFSMNSKFTDGRSCTCTIPRFASLGSGTKTYSFLEDFTFQVQNGKIVNIVSNPVLSQGRFHCHQFSMKATGSPHQQFVLQDVNPDAQNPSYIDDDGIFVFISKVNQRGVMQYSQAKRVNSLVQDAGSNDLACQLRFNQDKNLVVKFGDGINGRRLQEGSKVYVIYLKSDGQSGRVDAGQLTTDELKIQIQDIESQTLMLNMCYGGKQEFLMNYSQLFGNSGQPVFACSNIQFTNVQQSTETIDYQGLNSIKQNAPDAFRMGNRLVTSNDYRSYLMTNFKNMLDDVYVCNNVEYCTGFYKWLNDYGCLNAQIRILNYKFSGASDFNNIYLWLKPVSGKVITKAQMNGIVQKCEQVKMITVNTVPCSPIQTYFTPFIPYQDEISIQDLMSMDGFPFTKILVKKSSTYITDQKIRAQVAQQIVDYFEQHSKLGDSINLSDLYGNIMGIQGVQYVRTVSTVDQNDPVYVNGLSFASFTPSLIKYRDFQATTHLRQLQRFQYASLLNPDSIASLIEVTGSDSFKLKNTEF